MSSDSGVPRPSAGPAAVIFDLDGVIANSHPIHEQAWRLLLAEQGVDVSAISMDFIYAGKPRHEILRHYLGPLGEDRVESLGHRKDDIYKALAAKLAPQPGLLRVLDELDAAGIPYAIATCGGRTRTLETLERFGIAHRFAAVVTGDDVQRPKPEPDIFVLSASQIGVPPESVLVIEDSVAGVQAAHRAGMKCIAFVPEHRWQELLQVGVEALITDFPPHAAQYFSRFFAGAVELADRNSQPGCNP